MSHTASRGLSLPVVQRNERGRKRVSRMGPRRAAVLILLHLLIAAHIIHWLVAGRSVSPVEPSEAIYTLRDGEVNAGLIFFAVALLLTLVFGRFVCGWGCHLVAYQDLCGWMLKKVGIKPKPLRSRFLYYAPLALALYMFVWPIVHRLIFRYDAPPLTNRLMTSNFWETFPGPFVAVITFAVCGFLIIYVLGSKGFCTFACPYGGFFAPLDRLAPGRIRVTPDCKHCGQCTANCTSNVRVHEEVATYGMVVDPGCMKCMDCISVCPNDALYFGFGKPALGATPKAEPKKRHYSWPLWKEAVMAVVGFVSLVVYRGLYGQIPLLLAMGMGAITGYLFVLGVELVRDSNVRLQNLSLKRGGRWRPPAYVFAGTLTALLAFTGHSGVVRYNQWTGNRAFDELALADSVWTPGFDWWSQAPQAKRDLAERATDRFERVDRLGLAVTYDSLSKLVWLYLARLRLDEAEAAARRLIDAHPKDANGHYGLGGVLRKIGRFDEAEAAYREALEVDPALAAARNGLGNMLLMQGRTEDALALYREAFELPEVGETWRIRFANLLVRLERLPEATEEMRSLVADRPESAEARFHLGMCYLSMRELGPAVAQLTESVRLVPDNAMARFNLGVAYFFGGVEEKALEQVDEAVRLAPKNARFHAFRAELLAALGNAEGAAAARAEAQRLGTQD